MFRVYKSVNRFLAVEAAGKQEYMLLPTEIDQIPGPCPQCGIAGYLYRTPIDEVVCNTASCTFDAMAEEFEKTRRELLFDLAGTQDVVYYIQFRDRIKIGTSTNLQRRMNGVVVESLLGFEFGDYRHERKRHKQFQQYRSYRREWFDDCIQLRAHINDVCALT